MRSGLVMFGEVWYVVKMSTDGCEIDVRCMCDVELESLEYYKLISYCMCLIYLSIYLYLSTYLPIYLSTYLPIYLSIHASMYESWMDGWMDGQMDGWITYLNRILRELCVYWTLLQVICADRYCRLFDTMYVILIE